MRNTTRPLVDRILAVRGIADPTTQERFLEPRLTHLHEPAMLPGNVRAAERLVHAVQRDERIVIYGDYDVDGITATAILYHIIKAIHPEADVRTFVPHRLEDGYGLNPHAIAELADEGAQLIISVDCGITAGESAAIARERGIDLIITDHHNLPDGAGEDPSRLPDAFALVHPRLPGSEYGFGELCGAGVAFKLAWQFAVTWCGSQRVSASVQQVLMQMLPLAALGTIADVVPLVGENRILASFGLRLMKQTPLVGLRALIEASDLMGEHIDDQKVGFVLGPRLNACGRMGHAREAVRLLTDASADEAMSLARALAAMNSERQKTERAILEQAIELADSLGQLDDQHRAIVLAHEQWHPGVVGIVCSRLVDRFGRPAILMQRHGTLCKGSARSIEGYSIHDGIHTCRDMLTTFGGHDMAAGLSFEAHHLETFTERFVEHANRHITIDQLTATLRIDSDATLQELTQEQVKRLESLAPFGRGNPRPLVRISDAMIAQPPRQIGSQGSHVELRCRQQGRGGQNLLRCVWWNQRNMLDQLRNGQRIDMVIEPKLNRFNGRTSVEGIIADIRILS